MVSPCHTGLLAGKCQLVSLVVDPLVKILARLAKLVILGRQGFSFVRLEADFLWENVFERNPVFADNGKGSPQSGVKNPFGDLQF